LPSVFIEGELASICILAIELPKTVVNFSWEVEAQVIDSFTFKDFLWLIEFRSQKSLKVIIEYKVLKLSQLHGHQLLLNLFVDIVGFRIFEIGFHVNFLFKLRTDQQDELFMGVGVNQELLVAKLD